MNQDRLEAIRRRAEAATEGPWRHLPPPEDGTIHQVRIEAGSLLVASMGDTGWSQRGSWAQRGADALFIAHARSDIPALLDHVDALTRQIDEAATWVVEAFGFPYDVETPGDPPPPAFAEAIARAWRRHEAERGRPLPDDEYGEFLDACARGGPR